MGNAYGFMEITGVVAATDALDIMCKAADVSLATWERKLLEYFQIHILKL